MSRKPPFPINFKPEQKEWDSFWNWIYTNTTTYHIGPLVSVITVDPSLQRTREFSMLFFLLNKQTILSNPPKCICKDRYIHIYDHMDNCPIKQFNNYIMSLKYESLRL